MIVTKSDFDNVLKSLENWETLVLDTETTGLRPFHGDRLFSIIIHTGTQGYYFNFNHLNETDKNAGVKPLPMELLPRFQPLFNKVKRWVLANAKFDMHMLAQECLFLMGEVYDVLVMARLQRNDYMNYDLAACGERIGFKKSSAAEDYIKKYRCYKKDRKPGAKDTKNNPQYWMVPLSIVGQYGLTDGFVTYKVYEDQQRYFAEWDARNKTTSIYNVVNNEIALTKVCFEIERRGFLFDSEYVKAQLELEKAQVKKCMEQFKEITGTELNDHYASLKKSFSQFNFAAGVTEKGNPSYADDAICEIDHPAIHALRNYRDANKRASTYYSSFLFYADPLSVIHANFRQSATTTSRFSIVDPALQTLPSVDEDLTPEEVEKTRAVRRAFIPRPSFCLVAIDYKAFEFRAMLDTAGEIELAQAISGGLDPHRATAELVGITRKQAKTLNFGLLYGMGAAKLAAALGCSLAEAKRIKRQYFEKLPKIRELIYNAQYTAEQKQRVINRFGRPYHFPDSKWAYKALNALIQGGTADAVKFAMVELHEFLIKNHAKSSITLQIHDEIIFEIHKDEFHLIPEIKRIMEKAWPEKFHKMECSVDHSWKSWGDLEEGMPVAA